MEQLLVKETFDRLEPEDRDKLQRHCQTMIEDLEKSKFLSDKQYM